jgi:O-antigen/teichoic acid export membrane protein
MSVDAPPLDDRVWADEAGARRRIIGGGAWGAADFAMSMALGLPLTIILVRVLPRHVYGSIATAMSITILLSSVVALGLADSVARTWAWHTGADDPAADPHRPADVAATAWRMAAVAAGIGAILAVVLAWALSGSRVSAASGLVIIAIPLVMIYPLHSALIGVARVAYRPARTFVASVAASALIFVGTVGVLLMGARTGAPVVLVRVAGSLVGVAILVAVLRGAVPTGGRPSRSTARTMLRVGGAVMLVSLAASAISQLDVLAVGVFKGAVAAGVYAPLSRLLDLVIGAFAALGTYALVALSSAGARSTAALARQYHWCTRWTLVALGPALAVLLVAPVPVLHLMFGAEPPSVATVVRIMAVAACVHIGLGYNGLCLVALGQSRLVLLQGTAALLVSAAACLVLVPRFGLEGAAEATALALVASNLVSSVSLWRRFGVRPLDRPAAVTIVAFTVALAVCVAVERLVGGSLIVDALTFAIVGLATLVVAFQQGGGWGDEGWVAIRPVTSRLRHADPASAKTPPDVAR